MTKILQKSIDALNQRLKADHSSFRFNATKDNKTYRITKCEVQYTEKGKERLINVQVMFQYLEADEVLRLFIAMTTAIDVLI